MKTHEFNLYIQILQDDTLTGDLGSVDVATEKNLNGLVQVAEALLKKPVSKINLRTGIHEPVESNETNAEALKRYIYIKTLLIHTHDNGKNLRKTV